MVLQVVTIYGLGAAHSNDESIIFKDLAKIL